MIKVHYAKNSEISAMTHPFNPKHDYATSEKVPPILDLTFIRSYAQ